MEQFEDRTLTCVECTQPFEWSAREQAYFQEKGFANVPKRCRLCRDLKKARVEGTLPRERVDTDIVCDQCGQEATVPFKPRRGSPVFCHECFKSQPK